MGGPNSRHWTLAALVCVAASQVAPTANLCPVAVPVGQTLGLSLGQAVAGGPIVVTAVGAGGFAESQGVVVGDELSAVAGRSVADMSNTELQGALNSLDSIGGKSVAFKRSGPCPVAATTTKAPVSVCPMYLGPGKGLGVTLSQAVGGPIVVSNVEQGSWAAQQGVVVGDELFAVNGTTGMPWSQVQVALRAPEAKTLSFRRQGPCPATTTPAPAQCPMLAGANVRLGLSLGQKFPGAPILVTDVVAGGWAAKQGLVVGDGLVSINGAATASMAWSDLNSALSSPAAKALVFSRVGMCPPTTTTTATTTTSTGPPTTTAVSCPLTCPAGTGLGFSLGQDVAGGSVKVSAVSFGGWADKNGVRVGDELVSVNGMSTKTTNWDSLKAMLGNTFTRTLGIRRAGACPGPTTTPAAGGTTANPWDLGFTLAGSPPQPVTCAAVRPGSWADKTAGIQPGDTLVAINGKDVSAMTPEQLAQALKSRPLDMYWSKATSTTTTAGSLFSMTLAAGDGGLGLDMDGWPPYVVAAAPGGPAEKQGVTPGDELLSVNGRPVTGMTPAQLQDVLAKERPLQLQWRRAPPKPAGNIYATQAAPGDTDLGLSLLGTAPGEVRAYTVRQPSWASKQNVTAGDQLISVGGKPVKNMTQAELQTALDAQRPLQLVWKRREPEAWWYQTTTTTKGACSYTVTAGPEERVLGWSPDAFPPSQVKVMIVERDLWAEKAGVKVGDTLLTINGVATGAMAALAMLDTLQNTRPIKLTFSCGPGPSTVPPGGWPGGVAPSGWPGNQLINGTSTTTPSNEVLLNAAQAPAWRTAALAAVLLAALRL